MTISNTTNRRVYSGPGDEFVYDFPVFDDDNIYVVIVQDDAAGQIEPGRGGAGTYDFTISGSFDSTALRYPNGVTVTLNNPLPDDSYTIAIECRPSQTQESDYVNGGPLNAERLETDLDRLVTIAQYIVGEVEGAVRVSPTADVSIPPLIPQANAILVWDENGEAIVNRDVFGRWRDVWETDTLYVPLDIVRFEENGDAKDGNLYLCAVGHESDDFDNDLAAGRWQLIIDVAAVENAKDAAEAAQAAAETAESNAAASESAAATSESNAATSESNAATSETNAAASEELAEKWATEDEDVEVEGGKFSSYHWAQKAEDFAGGVIPGIESPLNVTEPSADTYEFDAGTGVADGQVVLLDIPAANTTASPTGENTGGSPSGAQDIVTTAGAAFAGMLEARAHRFQWDNTGSQWVVLDPAGGFVERGSNANGEYVVWGDGTAECWKNDLTLTAANSSAASVTWTFPIEFASAPNVSAPNLSDSNGDWDNAANQTNVSYPGYNANSTTGVLVALQMNGGVLATSPAEEIRNVQCSARGRKA